MVQYMRDRLRLKQVANIKDHGAPERSSRYYVQIKYPSTVGGLRPFPEAFALDLIMLMLIPFELLTKSSSTQSSSMICSGGYW
jgi:hypothetical protein